jgi:hypothetical protein
MIERYDIEKLRNLPIESVAQRLGLRVERHKSLCPFHDDSHPSLSYRVSKNTFRCFVCGASGGTIDLVMRFLHKDFKEACRWLGGAPLHKAIAIPSATLLKPADVELLKSLNPSPSGEQEGGVSTSFHMYPDRDEPGERLFLQLQQHLPRLEHHQLPPGCKDYSEFYLMQVQGVACRS